MMNSRPIALRAACATALCVLAAPSFGSVTIRGTSGNDVINVSSSSEPHTILALGGTDNVQGGSAADMIDGGSGVDTIYGNGGDDVIIGGTGNDFLYGGSGNDEFRFIGTTLSFDTVDGGGDFDSIVGSDANDTIGLLVRPLSIELIDGRGGYDVIRLPDSGTRSLNLTGITLVSIELIQGGTGRDTIVGSAGDDVIRGGGGNNVIDGGPGRDTAIYLNESESYVVLQGSPTSVRSLLGGGTDLLTNIEVITFADGHIEGGVFHPKYPDNNIPVAVPDVATMPEDGSVEVNLLANDYDPDGDPISVVTVGAPMNGTVSKPVGGTVVYTPRADFFGTDRFTYRVADNRYGKSYGSVTITVLAASDPPTARADLVSAVAGRTVIVRPLLNDSDPDGESVTLQTVNAPARGTVAVKPDGSVAYTAPAGFSGLDMFTYRIVDSTGQDANGTVQVNVIGPDSFVEFRETIEAIPEGSWVQLNRNPFKAVSTPKDQRPCTGYNLPSRVLTAWGSMAYDSNRRDLIFWGGGHANYCGNEVYRFRLSTLNWERASLPSAIYSPLNDNQYAAVDGVMNAPIAAHTYDNQEFLPQLDRFITFGGAKYNVNAQFVLEDGRTHTGPYLWDPSRANPNMVGGTTGSHEKPWLYRNVFGGEMWENRNTITVRGTASIRPDKNFVNSTSAYAEYQGKDAIYVTIHPDQSGRLFRYVINDLADPDKDTWELVGVKLSAYTGKGVGAYDSQRNWYVRSVGPKTSTGFLIWNLNTAGPANTNVRVRTIDLNPEFTAAGLQNCGMDYDVVRAGFAIWCTGGDVWYLKPPATFGTSGWQLVRAAKAPDGFSPPFRDPLTDYPGVLGKFKYARDLDLFFGVLEGDPGNVYAYKPIGWQPRE